MSRRNTDTGNDKPTSFAPSSRRLLALMGTRRRQLVFCVLLSMASVVLSLAVPKLLGRATDLVVQGTERSNGVDFLAVGSVLLHALITVLVSVGCALGRGLLAQSVAQHTAYHLRRLASAKMTRLPLSYLDGRSRGEVLSRITNDVDNVSMMLQQSLTKILASVFSVIGVLVMMLSISPLLTAVAVLMLPLTAGVSRWLGRRSGPQFERQWAATGQLNGHLEESITGHVQVTLFALHRETARIFSRYNQDMYQAGRRAQFLSGAMEPTLAFLGYVTYVLIAVIGGVQVASGAMSVGGIQAFITYTLQFNNPLTAAASLANVVQSGIASAERVFGLLDAEEQRPDPEAPQRHGTVTGRVVFENVSFSYAADKPLIRDLSLQVEPGQTVALVGPTGAGKTTLVNLLMSFYEVDRGRITLDGMDLTAMSRAELRSHIGMVLQDSWLFGGSIASNIAYGDLGATRQQIVEAARAARADHFIRTLPDGYETVLDEGGGGLSTGEKQLITIARAVLRQPPVLILDEATSSVDARTETQIQRAMVGLGRGRTTFVIAHRLSTIRNADTILVMDNGRIVGQGPHEELMATNSTYAELYHAHTAG
ncbi:ABC transporter ATP-binding protein [Streptomyces platensis]|uniref:ABC transporter ATP-binding protein n=1 Tax=Streptomyces platensis TaxID=58346 RepID=UPI0038662C5F|nr:ABC transporter ATP-binding protein/permease [Streptomyces platensis]